METTKVKDEKPLTQGEYIRLNCKTRKIGEKRSKKLENKVKNECPIIKKPCIEKECKWYKGLHSGGVGKKVKFWDCSRLHNYVFLKILEPYEPYYRFIFKLESEYTKKKGIFSLNLRKPAKKDFIIKKEEIKDKNRFVATIITEYLDKHIPEYELTISKDFESLIYIKDFSSVKLFLEAEAELTKHIFSEIIAKKEEKIQGKIYVRYGFAEKVVKDHIDELADPELLKECEKFCQMTKKK